MRVADEERPPEGPFLATLADGRLELNDRNVAAVGGGQHKRSVISGTLLARAGSDVIAQQHRQGGAVAEVDG